ncbi:probable LRR receptor-like serine/threonine-protein kinase isoform X2 [Tanacetum coccineum]
MSNTSIGLPLALGKLGSYRFISPSVKLTQKASLFEEGTPRLYKPSTNPILGRCGIITAPLQFGTTCFPVNLLLLPIYGADLVLGVEWLTGLGPILFDYKELWMEFAHGSSKFRIIGLTQPSLSQTVTLTNPLPIYPRDIKTSNILINPKLTAKVADFGLSRLAPLLDDYGVGPNYVSTVVRGTPDQKLGQKGKAVAKCGRSAKGDKGYLDPEYLWTHKLTDESDVYSLGVVLLEILTSMNPISHGKNIARKVKLVNQSGTMFSIIDNQMGSYPSACIEKIVSLALWCCNDKPEKRPSMLDVVRELEHVLDFFKPEQDHLWNHLHFIAHQGGTLLGTLSTRSSFPILNSALFPA